MYNFYVVMLSSLASSSAAIKTSLIQGWWSLPFRYVAKMATIECEKCPLFHTQFFDRFEYNIWISQCTAFCHIVSVNALRALKVLHLSIEVCDLEHGIRKYPVKRLLKY